ncbi:MAG TPA: DUF5723 family protein [Solimonas sp.]|jgi:hypothetical protein
MGTAYELVLQHWLENRRMNRIRQSLHQHLIVCGYGHSGQSAAQEAVARGTPPDQILVMERVGYVQKYDYEIKASRDAAILYPQIKNKHDLTPGTVYNLNLRAFHNRSQGPRLAHRHSRGKLDVEAGLTVLSGQALIDGSIHGVGSAVNSNEYAYNASVSYHYNEDVLFDRNVRGPSGEGFSLDLAVNYRFSDQWNLALSGSDLLGFLYWRDAPATSAVATSDTQEFDADGYLRFRPTLTGLEFNEDYRQRLHARGRAALQWQALQGTRLEVKLRMTEATMSAKRLMGR